jgi:hypothetical protein
MLGWNALSMMPFEGAKSIKVTQAGLSGEHLRPQLQEEFGAQNVQRVGIQASFFLNSGDDTSFHRISLPFRGFVQACLVSPVNIVWRRVFHVEEVMRT